MRPSLRRAVVGLGAAGVAVLLAAGPARAGSEEDGLVAAAALALKEGRPNDAVSAYEALADRGVVDPSTSFDRGIAYASRVKAGAEVPGDLGQAAHGLEEARALAGADAALRDDANRALTIVRGEIARRRARAGDPVDVEKGDTLGRSIVLLVSEEGWARAALLLAVVVGLALLTREVARAGRGRLAANVALSLSAPALVALVVLTLAARDDRLHGREGVVISPSARLADERGIALPAGGVLPEGARVRVLETRGALCLVRWGTTEAWVQSATIRPLLRALP